MLVVCSCAGLWGRFPNGPVGPAGMRQQSADGWMEATPGSQEDVWVVGECGASGGNRQERFPGKTGNGFRYSGMLEKTHMIRTVAFRRLCCVQALGVNWILSVLLMR